MTVTISDEIVRTLEYHEGSLELALITSTDMSSAFRALDDALRAALEEIGDPTGVIQGPVPVPGGAGLYVDDFIPPQDTDLIAALARHLEAAGIAGELRPFPEQKLPPFRGDIDALECRLALKGKRDPSVGTWVIDPNALRAAVDAAVTWCSARLTSGSLILLSTFEYPLSPSQARMWIPLALERNPLVRLFWQDEREYRHVRFSISSTYVSFLAGDALAVGEPRQGKELLVPTDVV